MAIAALLRDAVGLLDLLGRVVGRADEANLAGPHELVERAERLVDRRSLVRLVHLVDVDHVGAQAPERCLACRVDVRARAAALLGPGAAKIGIEQPAPAPAPAQTQPAQQQARSDGGKHENRGQAKKAEGQSRGNGKHAQPAPAAPAASPAAPAAAPVEHGHGKKDHGIDTALPAPVPASTVSTVDLPAVATPVSDLHGHNDASSQGEDS